MMKKDFFNKRKIVIIGVVAFLTVLIGSIFTVLYFRSTIIDNLDFEIVAENSSQNEVETDTNFLITSKKNYSVGTLKKIISLNPGTEYSLDKVAGKTYLLAPSNELKDNSIYNIYISKDGDKIDKSWAFQTKTNFKVSSTMPIDGSTFVDENTGIEMTFSKPVENINEFFEISPNVEGSFEYRDKKVIFKPNYLELDTPYKVTIKKGLKSVYGEELKESFSFTFRTEAENYFYLQNGFKNTFISSEIPSIKCVGDSKYLEDKFDVNVYRLSSLKEYVNFLEIHDNQVNDKVGKSTDYNFDMSKYPLYLRFSSVLVEDENILYNLRFPEMLDSGWYIADVKSDINKLHFQKAIQISDIAVYTYGLNGEVDVWCNDSETGSVISGATVQIGDLASYTNKDGVASFNLKDNKKQKVFITSKEGKEFGEYISLINESETNLDDNFYTYIYTDRGKYFPTDTINFWGAILPRKSGVDIPDSITVVMGEKEIEVKVNENGIFSGNIEISNYNSQWLSVGLKLETMENYLKGIEIVDYVKPIYKISSQFEKDYYRGSEKINLNVAGKFYDGTSAENIKLNIEYGNNESKTVILDSNGEAKVTIKPVTNNNDGEINYLYAGASVAGIDEYASSYSNVVYFPTDYYLKTEWDSFNQKLKFNTNKINYDAIDNGIIDYNEIYNGESFNQKVDVNIIEIEHIKRKTGEIYNYYTGMMEPSYEYESVEKVIDTIAIDVNKDEECELYIPLENKDNFTYKVLCSFTLPDGYVGNREVYIYRRSNYNSDYYYFTRDDGYKTLRNGESTTLKLNKESNSNNFRMIYFVSTDRVNKFGVTKENTVNISMSKELIPNCLVSGAVFDGKNVYELSETTIFYNTDEKKLNVYITTDKDIYKPGEKIKAYLSVKDKMGKPVKTELVVSAVNEATLVNMYSYNPINMLYSERYYMPVTFSSHYVEDFGGEGGGGDEEDLRDKFVDVLLFETLTTDENGDATVEFPTSDDLTSWRITAVAVSKDVSAGIATKNVSTSVPFFINQVINDKYSGNDDFTFSVRVAGNGIKGSSKMVEYEAKVDDMEIKKEVSESNKTVIFNFGKLSLGKHKVIVTAKSGEYSDGIAKEVEVVPSIGEISITKLLNISEISNIDAVKYPVRLMFFDKNNGLYYRALKKVIEQSNGMTNEQVFSRNFAYSKLNELYGNNVYDTSDNLILQDYTGGISKLPYSKKDPLITANICKIAPDRVNREIAISYFYEVINDLESSPEDVTAAYMGLSAFHEPVLNDVKYLLDNENGFELIDKINLISSLAYIGDYDLARKYYEKEIQGILTVDKEYKYIGNNYESKVYKANSRLLTILSIINHEDFEPILKYVLDNSSDEYISSLDLLVAFSSYEPISNVKSKMEYELNGKVTKVNFEDNKLYILTLDEKDMSSFKINRKSGDIEVIAEYIGRVSELGDISDNVKIEKTISKGELGEYSTVTLDINVGNNLGKYYLITDFIPVSSRYATSNYPYGENWGFSGYEKQKVNFYIDSSKTKNFRINYKIRNVLTGEYASENALAVSEDGIISGKSNDLIFSVK